MFDQINVALVSMRPFKKKSFNPMHENLKLHQDFHYNINVVKCIVLENLSNVKDLKCLLMEVFWL